MYKVVEPDLDLILGEFGTMEEAETFLDECAAWDKKNPQHYVPSYKIERV